MGVVLTATTQAQSQDPVAGESVLPELRTMSWQAGMQARATAGIRTVFSELPRWVGAAVVLSWRADRTRTLVVAVATMAAGLMSTFGLLATQRVLVELFAAAPTPDRVRAALPALLLLAATIVYGRAWASPWGTPRTR
jgi:ATP-binding cassette, subfamily B, bacterial